MSESDEDDAAPLAAAGPLAPPPEVFPPGVLPRGSPFAGKDYLDAWPVFGWIAWRTATWTRPGSHAHGDERTALEADLERAHCELMHELRAENLTAVARWSNKAFSERIDAAVFLTPGLCVTPHGYGYFTLDPGFHTSVGIHLVSFRFSVAEIAKCWPAPRAPSARPCAPAELRRVYEHHVAECVEAGIRPTVKQSQAAIAQALKERGYLPPTDRMMSRLRADPLTPEEWRRKGWHPGKQSKRDRE